ncbi:serine/threonine-protein kinase EDR1 isoform X1 [Gossypium australe]|uniref:non-specific serine/threonine protein kinase n=1 Tax=Gossypium australe TaxID=47621 RepID=A0A5B6V5Z1_9ROSI|nr:serine/threonine-protein kinase EDR1 isoform X1 [Gossypium australe]
MLTYFASLVCHIVNQTLLLLSGVEAEERLLLNSGPPVPGSSHALLLEKENTIVMYRENRSPEHPSFRARARSKLSGDRNSHRDFGDDIAASSSDDKAAVYACAFDVKTCKSPSSILPPPNSSVAAKLLSFGHLFRSSYRSDGASTSEARRIRRRSISMTPEISDDIVRILACIGNIFALRIALAQAYVTNKISSIMRHTGLAVMAYEIIMQVTQFLFMQGVYKAVRAMNETLKQNRLLQERKEDRSFSHSSTDRSPDLQENASNFHLDGHNKIAGGSSALYNLSRDEIDSQRAISLPSSPHGYRSRTSERIGVSGYVANDEMVATWNKILESPMFNNNPLLPYTEWNIDFSELTVGTRVGIGFFGEVFRGVWNGTDVAIKVFLEQDLNAENMEDFCNEISILSRLRHPNVNQGVLLFAVILFLGACTKPPQLSMITEYMEIGSLYFLIHLSGQKKRLSWRRRLKMLRDICRGLMCMHRMKIVHRDLKSANCLVNKHWTVKICDFGLSRIMTSRPMRDSASAGTPEWMAPELIRNEPFTEKCDIFSLGVIMWELCTLNRPWEGVPPERVVYAVANEGSRLEIPEGPLGRLISGTQDNIVGQNRKSGQVAGKYYRACSIASTLSADTITILFCLFGYMLCFAATVESNPTGHNVGSVSDPYMISMAGGPALEYPNVFKYHAVITILRLQNQIASENKNPTLGYLHPLHNNSPTGDELEQPENENCVYDYDDHASDFKSQSITNANKITPL